MSNTEALAIKVDFQVRQMNTTLRLIECTCSEASVRERLAADAGVGLDEPVSEIFLQTDRQRDPLNGPLNGPLNRPLNWALERFVQHQASLLATLVTLTNPDMIVIGGGIPTMPGYPRDSLIAMARDHLQKPWPANRDCFGFARLGNSAPLHGALALLHQQTRASDQFASILC